MDKCSSQINESFRKITSQAVSKNSEKRLMQLTFLLSPFQVCSLLQSRIALAVKWHTPVALVISAVDDFTIKTNRISDVLHPTHQELQSSHPTWHKKGKQKKRFCARFWLFFCRRNIACSKGFGGKPIHFPPKLSTSRRLTPGRYENQVIYMIYSS